MAAKYVLHTRKFFFLCTYFDEICRYKVFIVAVSNELINARHYVYVLFLMHFVYIKRCDIISAVDKKTHVLLDTKWCKCFIKNQT